MTTTNSTPSAAEALRLAFGIVSTPCSAAETQRAEVLLGIAREIREEMQYRATRASLMTFAGKPAGARAHRLIAEPFGVPADPEVTAVVPLDYGQRYQDDPAVTQRIRTPWQLGDKADCKYCRTPIELFEPTITGPYAGDYEGALVWRHKYTGQAACTVPAVAAATGADEVIAHTFATPSIE